MLCVCDQGWKVAGESVSIELWRPIWESKGNEPIAKASGRSNYTQEQVLTLVEDAARALKLQPWDSLLDIGCAAGLMGEHLYQMVKRYVGVDYSPQAIRRFRADQAFPGENSIEVVCASATDLPFKSGEFTKTLMSSVLLCLSSEECKQAIREMRRVTAVGGRGFVSGNLQMKPGVVVDPSQCSEGCRCDHHCTWFWPEDLKALAVECGWGSAYSIAIDPSLPQSGHQFDLVVLA